MAPRAHVRTRFTWTSADASCRATAFDAADRLIASVNIDLEGETRAEIFSRHRGAARLRVEDTCDRHLRQVLDLRF